MLPLFLSSKVSPMHKTTFKLLSKAKAVFSATKLFSSLKTCLLSECPNKVQLTLKSFKWCKEVSPVYAPNPNLLMFYADTKMLLFLSILVTSGTCTKVGAINTSNLELSNSILLTTLVIKAWVYSKVLLHFQFPPMNNFLASFDIYKS